MCNSPRGESGVDSFRNESRAPEDSFRKGVGLVFTRGMRSRAGLSP